MSARSNGTGGPNHGGNSTSNIPQGFFDDVLEDAKKRNVDIKSVQKKQTDLEWEEFQSFMGEVKKEDEESEKKNEEFSKDDELREKIEQIGYLERYGKILAVSDKEKREEVLKLEKEQQSEVGALMRKKRKRKREKRKEELDSEDVLDPLNWRQKHV